MLSLLEMSLSGGILIVVIVIVRAVAVNRLPKQVFLVLWAVAGLRLILPFALPSPTSVYTAAAQGLGVTVRRPGVLISQAHTAPTGSFPTTLAVWAVLALALALTFLLVHLRSRRCYRTALPVEDPFVKSWAETHRLRRPIQIRYSDQVETPFTYGFLWPVIVLPKVLLGNQQTLSFVLAHELAHVRRFDALWKWVLAAIVCIHWFNPLVWVMYLLAGRDLELCCDASVVKEYGHDARAPYALTLVSLEEKRTHLTPLTSSFSKNVMEERITAIMKLKKTTLAGIAAALALVAVVATVFATSATPDKTAAIPTPSASTPPSTAPIPTQPLDFPYDQNLDSNNWTEPTYTQAQYNLVKKSLLLDGWESMSIAKFNSAINTILNETVDDDNNQFGLRYAYEMLLTSLDSDDPLAPYLLNTVQASQDEYEARLTEVYNDKRCDPEFSGTATRYRTGDVYGDVFSQELATADYTFTYRILDQDKLTVAARDEFLQSVMQSAQDYLDSKTPGELIDDIDGEAHFKTALETAGKAATTNYIEFTGCDISYYISFDY